MKISMSASPKVRIEMLPLIDIVFLLLVVFIYTMLSMAVHRGLPVDLPGSKTAANEQDLTLAVTVKAPRESSAEGLAEGLIYVDEVRVNIDQLAGLLAERAAEMRNAGDREPGVLLFADRTIDYQQLFSVLDRINQAGLTRISLQADVER